MNVSGIIGSGSSKPRTYAYLEPAIERNGDQNLSMRWTMGSVEGGGDHFANSESADLLAATTALGLACSLVLYCTTQLVFTSSAIKRPSEFHNKHIMSTPSNPPPYSSPFRRRTLGRAPSPPTWACYEQIPYDDEYSDESASDDEDNDNSCSEDDEDYGHVVFHGDEKEDNDESAPHDELNTCAPPSPTDQDGTNLDVDHGGDADKSNTADLSNPKRDIKGKQRAVEPEHPVDDAPLPPPPKKQPHSRRRRQPSHTLRPILTIQKSQGFVWNQVSLLPQYAISPCALMYSTFLQDLFIPPYIKDRCLFFFFASSSVAFNSPLLSFGFR
jgi:hypothetical protein